MTWFRHIDCPTCGALPGQSCRHEGREMHLLDHTARIERDRVVMHWLAYMREYHPDDQRDFVVGTVVMGVLGAEPTSRDVEVRMVGGQVLVRCALGEFD